MRGAHFVCVEFVTQVGTAEHNTVSAITKEGVMPESNNINEIPDDDEEEIQLCHFTGVVLTDDTLEHELVTFRRDSAITWDPTTMSHGYRHVEEYVNYTNELVNSEYVVHLCDDCDNYFHRELYNIDHDRCNGCNDSYSECCDCGTEAHDDYSYRDDDGNPYCEDCWRDSDSNPDNQQSRTIQSYSFRPSPVFGWVVESQLIRGLGVPRAIQSEPMFGLELETNARDRSTINDASAFLLGESPDEYLYNKEDGSISGFEIVTHPFTLEAHKMLFPRDAIAKLSSQYSLSSWSSVNGTGAGLHVHISKKSFAGSAHQFRFQMFHYRNADFIKKFAGRDSDRWASFRRTTDRDDYGYDDMVEICKGNRVQNNRYSALNFQNANTIELRYFRGSLKPETVLGVLEFCHSVHAYTKLLTAKEVIDGCLAWGSYKILLADQNYEHLPQVLATRCV